MAKNGLVGFAQFWLVIVRGIVCGNFYGLVWFVSRGLEEVIE